MSDLRVGDRAMKIGGSYQATGTIVASFSTRASKPRFVFEFDTPPGLLHIFGPAQLERIVHKPDGIPVSELEGLAP